MSSTGRTTRPCQPSGVSRHLSSNAGTLPCSSAVNPAVPQTFYGRRLGEPRRLRWHELGHAIESASADVAMAVRPGGLSDGHPLTRLLETHPARRGGKPRSPALGRPVGAPPGESSPGWGTALRVGLRRCGDPTLRSPERMCPPKCLPLGHKTAPFKETSRHAPWATPGELNLNWGYSPDPVA